MAAVFATILVPLVARRSNTLFYAVVCEAYLIDKAKPRKAEGSKESSKPHLALFVIDVHNPLWGIFRWLGGVDIAPSQYERRIAFSFGDDARILEAEVVEENPQGIGAEVIADHFPPDKLVLTPVLLNQGDKIRLKIVVEAPDIEAPSPWLGRNSVLLRSTGHFTIGVEGRILGVRKIRRKRGSQELLSYAIALDAIALLPMTVVTVIGGVVWLLTGNPDLYLAAPMPWFAAPVPTPLLDPITILTGAQTALLFVGQLLLLIMGRRTLRARKVAERYSPTCTHPLPLN
jgi:hypothetical protein